MFLLQGPEIFKRTEKSDKRAHFSKRNISTDIIFIIYREYNQDAFVTNLVYYIVGKS